MADNNFTAYLSPCTYKLVLIASFLLKIIFVVCCHRTFFNFQINVFEMYVLISCSFCNLFLIHFSSCFHANSESLTTLL